MTGFRGLLQTVASAEHFHSPTPSTTPIRRTTWFQTCSGVPFTRVVVVVASLLLLTLYTLTLVSSTSHVYISSTISLTSYIPLLSSPAFVLSLPISAMMKRSTSQLARLNSRAPSTIHSPTFSTFLSAVNANTLGFLREKLLTHGHEATTSSGTQRRGGSGSLASLGGLNGGNHDGQEPGESAAAALAAVGIHKLKKLPSVSRELHRNIFFNSNERSALRHVELTKDHIRLEFSEANEEYRKHAGLLFATEIERQGVPQWLIPVGLQNNEHCGGGATILLDKRHVYDSLMRGNQSKQPRATRH